MTPDLCASCLSRTCPLTIKVRLESNPVVNLLLETNKFERANKFEFKNAQLRKYFFYHISDCRLPIRDYELNVYGMKTSCI